MEGETDLTSRHQVLEEGDKFESSFLRLDRCCFLALLSRHTCRMIFGFLWSDLPSRMRMQVVLKLPPHHRIQSTKSGRMGKIIEDEIG